MKIKELLYLKIAGTMEKQIRQQVFLYGSKLPSVRAVCDTYGVSMTTALQAYMELDKKALIQSRPKSGYFVIYKPVKFPPLPRTSNPGTEAGNEDKDALIHMVYNDISTDKTLFSLGVPENSFLPIAKLSKSINRALRNTPFAGTAYEQMNGNVLLRKQIAKSSYTWNGQLNENDILTTFGCSHAMACCLQAITQRGDTIAVESPVYFGILQMARNMGLKVVEVSTNAQTGIDPDALERVIIQHQIKACILISNFSNPLGSSMPAEHKKKVVKMMTSYDIPLIENDMYGDIYFGSSRPDNCKTYDTNGIVLLCSSVSKSLAPGYRVGWVSPGKYMEAVRSIKFTASLSSNTLMEASVADFLAQNNYENHLRRLRNELHSNCLNYLNAIHTYFPKGTKVSRPQGGFMLWVELDTAIDTSHIYHTAIKHQISIAPGSIFTQQNQYNNCLRLSYGLKWNEKIDHALKVLGNLIHQAYDNS